MPICKHSRAEKLSRKQWLRFQECPGTGGQKLEFGTHKGKGLHLSVATPEELCPTRKGKAEKSKLSQRLKRNFESSQFLFVSSWSIPTSVPFRKTLLPERIHHHPDLKAVFIHNVWYLIQTYQADNRKDQMSENQEKDSRNGPTRMV